MIFAGKEELVVSDPVSGFSETPKDQDLRPLAVLRTVHECPLL